MLNGLVSRILGAQFCINLNITNSDAGYYKIHGDNDCLSIESNNLNSAQYVLGRYVRQNEILLTPNNLDWIKLPLNSINKPYSEENLDFLDVIRYYQNVCTESYSFAFWNWTRWERELDWMALNGFNTGLLTIGQEIHFLKALGGNSEILSSFFTAVPFSAWHRMGNLKRFGGGQDLNGLLERQKLSKQIFDRMIELKIKPILPAFAGFVPDFYENFKNFKYFQGPNWPSNQFNETFTGLKYFNVSDAASYMMFAQIGEILISSQKQFYGYQDGEVDYYADTFNEMTPVESKGNILTLFSRAVYDGINSADKKGKWFMQGWLFHSSKWFWQKDNNKLKYLSGVPKDRLIILDLMSEADPIYKEKDGYNGRNFIWNMLNNFGGNYGMVGHIENLLNSVNEMKNFDNMIGFGYAPEGTGRNYFLVDLLTTIWGSTKKLDINEFIKNYSKIRYRVDNSMGQTVYKLLVKSVFNDTLEIG